MTQVQGSTSDLHAVQQTLNCALAPASDLMLSIRLHCLISKCHRNCHATSNIQTYYIHVGQGGGLWVRYYIHMWLRAREVGKVTCIKSNNLRTPIGENQLPEAFA